MPRLVHVVTHAEVQVEPEVAVPLASGTGSPLPPEAEVGHDRCQPGLALRLHGPTVERLEVTCGPDNIASQRVARRAGFRAEGLLRSHTPFKGARRDTLLLSLLPSDLHQARTE